MDTDSHAEKDVIHNMLKEIRETFEEYSSKIDNIHMTCGKIVNRFIREVNSPAAAPLQAAPAVAHTAFINHEELSPEVLEYSVQPTYFKTWQLALLTWFDTCYGIEGTPATKIIRYPPEHKF